MSNQEAMQLLRNKVAETSQADVARRLGYQPSAINQLLRDKYNANPDAILQKVREVFGTETVTCPVLGEITLGRCSEEKKKEFAPVSSAYVRQRKACRACDHNDPQGPKGGKQ